MLVSCCSMDCRDGGAADHKLPTRLVAAAAAGGSCVAVRPLAGRGRQQRTSVIFTSGSLMLYSLTQST
jgi:hypothetical protein